MRTTLSVLACMLVSRIAGADVAPAEIMHGSVAVANGSYRYYEVRIDAEEARIKGNVTAEGGSGNDIRVYVLTKTDFLNWKNNHATNPIYSSGQVTAADVDAP